jgi:hypothetical protein
MDSRSGKILWGCGEKGVFKRVLKGVIHFPILKVRGSQLERAFNWVAHGLLDGAEYTFADLWMEGEASGSKIVSIKGLQIHPGIF